VHYCQSPSFSRTTRDVGLSIKYEVDNYSRNVIIWYFFASRY